MAASPFPFLLGCNYPWTLLNGVSNYGRDVGVTPDGVHTGTSTRRDLVASDFAAMRALGLTVVRWFLFCDGRAGIRFDDRGIPAGLAGRVFDDLDVALDLAAKTRLLLMPVFFDYLWMFDRIENRDQHGNVVFSVPGHPDVVKSEEGRRALLDTVIIPILDRYASSTSVFAWELMNEPDWVVEGPDLDRRNVSQPMSFEECCSFVRDVGAEVRSRTAARYTLGTARARGLERWGKAELGVDFLQVHAYEDFWTQGHDLPLRGRRVEELGVNLPVVVGEYPINGGESAGSGRERIAGAGMMEGFVDGVRESGFAGALFWSFNNVDRCGLASVEDIGAALAFAAPRLLSGAQGSFAAS